MRYEQITGTVTEIVFANRENGFTVCELDINDTDPLTVVGILPALHPGQVLTVEGNFKDHPIYGRQLEVKNLVNIEESTESEGWVQFLASGLFRGVGMATARKIVDAFGADTMNIIQNDATALSSVPGISLTKAKQIQEDYFMHMGMQSLALFLQKYGVSAALTLRVWEHYGLDAVSVIQKNPYRLARDLPGVGFLTVDAIGLKMGFAKNAPERLGGGLCHLLEQAAANGHTYLPREILIAQGAKAFESDPAEVEDVLVRLALEDDLVVRKAAVYLPRFHEAETSVAADLKLRTGLSFEDKLSLDEMSLLEEEMGLTLDPQQLAACETALQNGVMVLTGGPGTGKTTIVRAIIRLFELRGKKVALAAPTGRAAKRMESLCGREAKTVHRLLETEYSYDEHAPLFRRRRDNPIPADVLIVDEMSMMDILLFSSLLDATLPSTRVVLVGDADQLPAVGAGNVLRDLIDSGVVSVTALDKIFRQAAKSLIVQNAHRINHGEMPVNGTREQDFFCIPARSFQEISDLLLDLVENRLPAFFKGEPSPQIQLLSPTKKTPLGVWELNRKLQDALNPHSILKREYKHQNRIFRVGDRVMQIKNNYELEWTKTDGSDSGMGVYNGDTGVLTQIKPLAEKLTVVFDDDRVAEYPFSLLEELELAYAITVHKSQGSEYDAVVFPLFHTSPRLLTRNLFYTAVTRAKRLVVLVGNEELIREMVENTQTETRYSGLSERLRG